MQPAIFLDRDGTMIEDAGYLHRLDDIRWFPWTIDAIRLLNRAGFLVCVTTNQAGLALGLLTPAILEAIIQELSATLAEEGARIDGWFHCPHHPDGVVATLRQRCDCRKPEPGMIRQAQAQFAIDVSRSFVVGDKLADVEMAGRVGASGVLVRTGYGEAIVREHDGHVPGASHVAFDLMDATAWILEQSRQPRRDA